jgi:UDP-2-acetamido-2-deoxy-ribo-hexuluronate aminotransferase
MEFCDLKVQYLRYQEEIDKAIQSVLASSAFINGPEVASLEKELADFSGASHAVACANGTDALFIALLALGVRPGDEIIVPDFTFFATAEAVALAGGVPRFADIDSVTFNATPATIERQITSRTKGIIPVSLFGQIPDLDGIGALAAKRGLWVLEDGAQSFGATRNGRRSCSLTPVATTSFFPAKPLGAYGDGGAVFATDPDMARRIRTLANHGSVKRYHHSQVGVNSRLDSIQAAVLRVKLRHFEEELGNRERAARRYTELLKDVAVTPVVADGNVSSWAQYTLRVKDRDRLQARLQAKGIPTAIHYPIPMHAQEAFAHLGGSDGDYPVASCAAGEVISLPMHGMMSDAQIVEVCSAVNSALKEAL